MGITVQSDYVIEGTYLPRLVPTAGNGFLLLLAFIRSVPLLQLLSLRQSPAAAATVYEHVECNTLLQVAHSLYVHKI
jgi:hypothetical protein